MKKINQIEPHMDNKEKKELISVINSGWFTEASKTRQFEKMFADFVGVKYACAVTSGTTALYVGLKALGMSCECRPSLRSEWTLLETSKLV